MRRTSECPCWRLARRGLLGGEQARQPTLAPSNVTQAMSGSSWRALQWDDDAGNLRAPLWVFPAPAACQDACGSILCLPRHLGCMRRWYALPYKCSLLQVEVFAVHQWLYSRRTRREGAHVQAKDVLLFALQRRQGEWLQGDPRARTHDYNAGWNSHQRRTRSSTVTSRVPARRMAQPKPAEPLQYAEASINLPVTLNRVEGLTPPRLLAL
eukprot:scaffold2280_cov430-Prasinococcus_capsulatus_cf.AAC.8